MSVAQPCWRTTEAKDSPNFRALLFLSPGLSRVQHHLPPLDLAWTDSRQLVIVSLFYAIGVFDVVVVVVVVDFVCILIVITR